MEINKKNQVELPGKVLAKDNENLKKWLFLILSHWYLFIIFIFIGLVGAFLVNSFTVPIYKVTSSVLIKPEQKKTPTEPTTITGFESDENDNFVNQTILLKTPTQIKNTLDQLDFNICYYSRDRFKVFEFYPDMPFKVSIDSSHAQPLNVEIHLKIGQNGKLFISASGNNVTLYNFRLKKEMGFIGELKFDRELIPGKTYTTNHYAFSINPTFTPLNKLAQEGEYFFVFKSNEMMVNEFSDINLSYATTGATVVNINHTGTCLNKSKTFLNQLMLDMVQANLDKKDQIANNTIKIINKQLSGIGDTLHTVTNKLQNFRASNKVVLPEVQAQSSYVKLEALEAEQNQLELQKDYLDQLKTYLSNREDFTSVVAPSAVGLDAPDLGAYLKQLSEIRGELFQYMGQSKLNNPYLTNRKKQENILMASIQDYIKNIGERINIKIKSLALQKERYTREQNRLPAKEKELVGIERSFKLTDNLYTMLREKGIEAQIKKASNVADNQIVEMAQFSGMVKPETTKIYACGLAFGLILPIFLLFIQDFFNNKIVTHEDLERLTHAPVFGSIPENSEDVKFVSIEKPSSPISEAFRILRTRLKFIAKGQSHQIIMLSSTVSGEGKTFCAVNLAGIMALSGKKTLLMGMDLRKPRLEDYIQTESKKGITDYLMNESTLEEVIQPTVHPHLDCILSGPIQPNPAELITSEKMSELFKKLKKIYDYIIIDTSPVGLVADALLISPYCNAMLYVVRHKFTVKQLFAYNIGIVEDTGIQNLGILMNDVKTKRRGYGYGYDYGYRYGYGYGYSYGYGYGEKETKKSKKDQPQTS